mgnify:CR=1 FL=1
MTHLIPSIIVIALATACHAVAAAEFHVSPTGDDANPGTEAKPFATLERARDAAREAKAGGAVTVCLHGGRHELARPLEFTAADAGTKERPIVWCAYRDEKPIVSGGTRIAGWRRHDEKLWAADVPWVRTRAKPFYQLFVNGQRRVRARMPNEGSYFYTKRLQLTQDTHPVCLGITYRQSDLAALQDAAGATVVLFHNWVNSFNRVGRMDRERSRITFARPAGVFFLGPEVRYYVEGVREALDAPGEWHLDAAQGVLYYHPLPGEDMSRAEVIAPRLASPLVTFRGAPEAGPIVEYLVFRGISFQHADADLSPDYPHSVQGAHTQKGALFAVGLRHATIENCEFTRLGEHGVSLREGCVGNVVRQCRFHDLGGGGVYLSEGSPASTADWYLTARNVVDNNFIHDGGKLYRAACGVFLGGSASYNQITHNEICDLSWTGVHLGWSWTGRAPAYTHHNEVGWNHIHHLGNGVLNDIGGIYTLGVSPGTVLHHNLIHHVTRFERGREGYGGWGIYLDAGSSEIVVENNVVYNTRDGGLHLHCYAYPYGNTIRNNVFAYSEEGQWMRNADHEPETNHAHLERNIVYNANPRMLWGSNWKAGSKFTADRNCYWSESAPSPDFDGRSLAEWQKAGRDQNGIVADPKFVNPKRHDFRLQPDSPALKLGFKPIDIGGAGLYGPESWRGLPRGVTHRTVERAAASALRKEFVEGFEDYDVGEAPPGAVAKEGQAEAAVTDREPASGQRCLRFVDAAGVTDWKPHWYVQRTPGAGKVRMRCFLKNDAAQPATIGLEFRDWFGGSQPGDRYATGPYLRFLPDGVVQACTGPSQAGWVPVGRYELGRWLGVEVEFEEGEGKPKTCTLRLIAADGTTTKEGLPFCNPAFKLCTWCGFVGLDTKPAVFYVDDVHLE